MIKILVTVASIVVGVTVVVAVVFVATAWYEAHEWDIEELYDKLVERFRRTD